MRVTYNILGIVLAAILSLLGAVELSAQYLPERALVREGNSHFERRNYRTSLNRYQEALERDSTCYEAAYNRANAYHFLKLVNPADSTLKWEVGNEYFEHIAADTLLTRGQRAEVLRNLGESLFTQQKYESALNSFRESLRLNPDDDEVKHNYILTKRIVDQKRKQQQDNQQNNQNQNQDGGGQNQEQNNQNQDQGQDQNQDQNQNQDKNQDKNQDQNQGEDNPEDQPQEQDDEGEPQQQPSEPEEEEGDDQTPPPSGISREEQERMLDAIQAQEDKTQDKLKEGEKAIIIPGKKNW